MPGSPSTHLRARLLTSAAALAVAALLAPLAPAASAAAASTASIVDSAAGELIEAQRLGLSEDADDRVGDISAVDARAGQSWSQIASVWTDDLYGFTVAGSADATDASGIPDGLPDDRSQVFVVLGNKLNDDGTAKAELVDRLEVAKAALTKYPNARVLVTGGHTAGADKASEGEVMAAWLTANGIAEDRVIVETESSDTPDNATLSMPMLYAMTGADKVSTISVITSQWHQRRGTILFEAETRLLADELGVDPITVVDGASCKTSNCSNSGYVNPPAYPGDSERNLIAQNVAKVASNVTAHAGLGAARGVSDAYSAAASTTAAAQSAAAKVLYLQRTGYTGAASTTRTNLLDVRRALAETADASTTYRTVLAALAPVWDAALASQTISAEIPDDLSTSGHAFVLMGADGGNSTAMRNRIALAKQALAQYPNSIVVVAGNSGELTAGVNGLTTGDGAIDSSRIRVADASTDAPSGAVNVMRLLYSLDGEVTTYTPIVSSNYVRRPTVLFAAAGAQQRVAQRAAQAIEPTGMIAEPSTGTGDAGTADSGALDKIATNVAQVFGITSQYSARNATNTPLSTLQALTVALQAAPTDAGAAQASDVTVSAELDDGTERSVDITDLATITVTTDDAGDTTYAATYTYRGVTASDSLIVPAAVDDGGSGDGDGEAETPDQPVIALGADTVVAGGTVQISGTGLPAGEQAGIELHSEPVSLGTATVSDTGALDVTVTIPASTEAGEHTIVVRLADDSTVTAPLTVTAASAGTDDGGDGGTTDGNAAISTGDGAPGGSSVAAVDDAAPQGGLAVTGLSGAWGALGAAGLLALIAGALLWAARGTRSQHE